MCNNIVKNIYTNSELEIFSCFRSASFLAFIRSSFFICLSCDHGINLDGRFIDGINLQI